MQRNILNAAVMGMSTTARPIREIAVIGGGVFGCGIAQVAAEANHTVTLVDLNHEILNKSKEKIKRQLKASSVLHMQRYVDITERSTFDEGVKDYISRVMRKIRFSDDISESVKNCDLILEAVPDDLDSKVSLLMHLDKIVPEHALLATSSPAFSINDTGAKIKRCQKFCGVIFLCPPQLTNWFEVVRAKLTSDMTVEQIQNWGEGMGKTSFVCYDSPGFVVNYLTIVQAAEAVRLFERGWHKQRPWNDLFKPIRTTLKLVEEGKLGVKTGEGFYKYNENGKKKHSSMEKR